MADSIVIASAARTPIGGRWETSAGLAAGELGRRGREGRGRTRRRARRQRRRSAARQLPDGRPGPGAGAPGCAQRRPPDSAGAVTLSKMCGSGMRAMMFAHDMLAAGSST